MTAIGDVYKRQGGGLCSFSKETETFVDFDPENVWLPDKVIYSIEQDQACLLYTSSLSGKSMYLYCRNGQSMDSGF